MSEMIEAGSLSSLTTLASNPPSYPRNPTEQERSPLVLYIARVPGSKDVFLSPLKPKQKVVSAQDVESSLYYVHIEQPEDEVLLREEQLVAEREQNAQPLSEIEEQDGAMKEQYAQPLVDKEAPPLPRRPAVGERSSTTERTTPSLPRRPLHSMPQRSQTAQLQPASQIHKLGRKPVASSIASSSPNDVDFRSSIDAGQVQRKPLTGRPLPAIPVDNLNVVPANVENVQPEFRAPLSMPDIPPALPPRHRQWKSESGVPQMSRSNPPYPSDHLSVPFVTDGGFATAREDVSRPSISSRIGSYSSQYLEEGVQSSITLIRRDPTSGAQWNVGRISDPPITEISSETMQSGTRTEKYKRMGAPMYVEITNPGYNKFIDRPNSSSSQQSKSQSNNNTFERRIYLEGSRAATHSYANRPSSAHGSFPSSNPTPSDKGYAFLSPWDGKCQFSTGGSGRSVTCRHSISSGSNASMSDIRVLVSELRFNLPPASGVASLARPKGIGRFHSEVATTSTSSAANPVSAAPISPILANMAAEDLRQGRDSFDFDDVEGGVARLDLSLGQERAGGGFSGKQAKLGKLILWDEGLKMMDLLVAANVALWCRAYGSVEPR
ncbi:hypothetical protein EV356DRAFT_229789 [Viridothelium virens]|uniref:Uncharacterized protein n=1 Tax=Viridothelium virens TaxID=1048519 RepID=A0A6A6H565_VIRVR|nr:hypothetical protein EV356DRAFT_229789 [Viridothelium virens]